MSASLYRLTLIPLLSLIVATAAAAQAPAVVELGTVTEGNASPVIRLPGTVISTRDAEIAAELSGRLTWLAEVGDNVEQGQPLALIDDHLLQLQLRNDEAEIARIEADLSYNQRQISRLERLARDHNTAESELDRARSQLQMQRQELQIANVARDRTRYDLSRCQVTAPFGGVVASRDMSIGEYTSEGRPLLRLVDTSALEIRVNAPLRVARYNQPGTEVQVEGDAYSVTSPIRGVVPVGNNRSKMMELRLQAHAGEWIIGEAVTVELPEGPAQSALRVPRDALVLRDQQVYVYTVSSENVAVRVPVITGPGHGTRVAVQGDLEPGSPVVVRGAERLREGQAVKVTQHHLAAG